MILAVVVAGCGATTADPPDEPPSTTVPTTTTTTPPTTTSTAPPTTTTTMPDVSSAFVEHPNSPVLVPTGWDSGYTAVPNVIRDGERWLMFYTGEEAGLPDPPGVGVAESPDGINWTRVGDGPTYNRQASGGGPSWVFATDTGEEWVLHYTTGWSVGFTSVYRVTGPTIEGPWSEEVEALEPPRDDWNRRILPTGVTIVDGVWWMPYAGWDIDGKNASIGYFLSTDGKTWESVDEPILTPDEEWNRFAVVPMNVIETDLGLELWYLGFDRPPDIRIRNTYSDILFGRLISTDGGGTWTADADGGPIGSTGEKGWPGVSVALVDGEYRIYGGDDLGQSGIKLVVGTP